MSSQQLGVLGHLAEMVVRRVERDKQILLQQHSKTALLRSLRTQQEAVLLCDIAMTSWPVLFTNKSCPDMLGWDEGTLGGRGVWDIFKMDAGAKVRHCVCVFCLSFSLAWWAAILFGVHRHVCMWSQIKTCMPQGWTRSCTCKIIFYGC